jgi:aspartyl-tRNA(Asn)/glutamyl-tRNA(Gln) amidotransferase subunit A
LGEKVSDPLSMYLSDIYTVAVNIAGLPGLSLPCGKAKNSLPVGLQIIGQPFEEEKVFQAGLSFEKS